ncbi:tetratricopeptide repeat protein [Luteimonas notoginsengisoli]|uniref:Tetratricopeptide repeat protein n=1 Tax=Luteimonas notoginsengisoli TaxID=1578200 RepID=A0ABV7UT49_9GAMM
MPVTLRFPLSTLLPTLLFACFAPLAAQAAEPPAMTPDTLTATMAGEYALHAGRLDEAADWYLQAARSVEGDAGLAERATRIALLGNDNARSARALKLWRQRAPHSLAMGAAEATLSLRDNKLGAARRQLESLLRDPDPRGWRYAVAAMGSGGKDPKATAQVLGELVDADAVPDDLQTWLVMGGLAQRLGDAALAERIVAAVIEHFPDEPRVALLRASQLRESDQPDQARAVLATLAKTEPMTPDLRLSIASEYDALGDSAAAAAVLAQGPQDDQLYGLRASLLAKADDKPALRELYEELKQGAASPDPARRLLLGQTAEFLDLHAEALEWYRSVAGGPPRAQARLRIAKVLHDLDRDQESWAALRELQADASLDDDARRDGYLLEAELRLDDGDASGELDAYARGLAAYPDEPELLYARGLMWERRDDIARAEADLRRILVADPDNVPTLNALGYTLADRTTRYEEALQLIDRARVADPDNPAIIDSHGWVLYRLGRNDEALAELRRAFALQKDAEIGAHLGEVLWVTGHKDEARRYFEEARKLDPDNRSLKRALEKTGA